MLGKLGAASGHSILLQNASSLFQLTDLSAAAHNWKADSGITISEGKISSWLDDIGGATLSQNTDNHRPLLDQTDDFDIIDMLTTTHGKILTIDGSVGNASTGAPALPALNQETCYIAITFLTTQASAGGLLSVDDVACILPYWSGSPVMYVPKQSTDGIESVGNSDIVFNQWHILTLNYKSDSIIVRLDGVEIHTESSPKTYNFDRFSLNRRISSGAVGYNKIRQLFIADDGLSDADNLLVEGLLAQDLLNAPA